MSAKYECAVCSGRISNGHDICGKCSTQLRELYGDEYKSLDWFKELTANKRYMERLEKEEAYGFDSTSDEKSSFYLFENSASADITGRHATHTGTSNHYTVPIGKYYRANKYDTQISKYMRQGLGHVRIYNLLAAEYGAENVPSKQTIYRRMREYRGLSNKRYTSANK